MKTRLLTLLPIFNTFAYSHLPLIYEKSLAHFTLTHVVSNILSPLTPGCLFPMAWPHIINLINIQDSLKILCGFHHHAPPILQLRWIKSAHIADSETRMGWVAQQDEPGAAQNH